MPEIWGLATDNLRLVVPAPEPYGVFGMGQNTKHLCFVCAKGSSLELQAPVRPGGKAGEIIGFRAAQVSLGADVQSSRPADSLAEAPGQVFSSQPFVPVVDTSGGRVVPQRVHQVSDVVE